MENKGLILWVFLTVITGVAAQDSCSDLLDPCEGDPQQYECVKITSFLTNDQGGESSQLLQEYCFKVDSPLFQEFLLQVDKGRLDLSGLKEGDEIGKLLFALDVGIFGEECPLGNDVYLKAPIIVTETFETSVDLLVQFTEANPSVIECVLRYDPTVPENNNGKILEGSLANLTEGGFEMFLELAELEEGAIEPGLEMGDIRGTATPAPLFFDVLEKDDIFILPAEGGELTVKTELAGQNRGFDMISMSDEDVFDIKPGTAQGLFKRGDVNDDAAVNLADAISLLSHLFSGAPTPDCPDSADSNDDGALNLADAISILSYLFSGGTLSPPGIECGSDVDADELAVCEYTNC